MSTLQHVIQLYIHPDVGPITPVEIDMMAVETEALKQPASSDYDEIRIQAICRLIRQKLPQVEPERNRQGIVSIIGRLRNVFNFSGIVLRLPGTIVDKSAPSQSIDAKLLERLTREVERLKQAFETEQQTNAAQQQSLLQDINHLNSANHYTKIQRDVLETEMNESKVELDQCKLEVEQLLFERADLQTRLEQAALSQSQSAAAQGEISSLRQSLASAKQAEQQLRQTLEQREKVISGLREQIRRLSDDVPAGNVHDDNYNPFHDL